ncbi:hypothetical protein AQJ30_15560 [Streptomyces longwoodensis]|uniref:Lon proteolytic domain-containing protein n=1 Tax=Streptomyces longwoodensis TaxID=68231 RepID=A0A101QX79_9ACTN|nr:magnesium chelatase domain-containing protein [Streptomyces longwoodensis]KUN37700.1 hypothetical protein AQJ30_15560 [Streptomyces longwoodensis]
MTTTTPLTKRCTSCGNTWPSTDGWGGTVAYCTECAKTADAIGPRAPRPARNGVIDTGTLIEDGNPFNLRYAVLDARPGDVLDDIVTPDYVVGDALYRTGVVVDADHRGLGVAWPADTRIGRAQVRAASDAAAVIHATVSPGLGSFALTGVAHDRETRDRVRAAITNGGCPWPTGRLTVTVETVTGRPLDASHDLAIACAILGAAGHYRPAALDEVAFVGGLGLGGRVRLVADINAAARAAIASGCTTVIVPEANMHEFDVPEVSVYCVATIAETVRLLQTFDRAAS